MQLMAAIDHAKLKVIQNVINSYSRPVTVYALSPDSSDYLPMLCSEYPQSVFISKSYENANAESNLILIEKDPSFDLIHKISRHEHIDIAYYFGNCVYKPKELEVLFRLVDQIILEYPIDLYKLMNSYLKKNNIHILDLGKSKVLVLVKRSNLKFLRSFDRQEERQNLPLMTSTHYAVVNKESGPITQDPGISLFGFVLLGGIRPSRDTLKEMIQQHQWNAASACLPWNIMVQGSKLTWRKRFDEPLTWSKEAIDFCIDSLSIQDVNKYKYFIKKQIADLRIAN